MGNKKVGMLFFLFLLAVTEVNCMLAYSFFNKEPKVPMLNFWKALARELLHNPYLPKKTKIRRKRDWSKNSDHVLINIPTHKKFKGSKLVPWKTDYFKVNCHRCAKTKVRTYCQCTPGHILCVECYADHRINEVLKEDDGT